MTTGNISDDTTQEGVTFVVTVYNKEPYLEETLQSVFAQEGDFEREIIVVDDGSTDGSLDAIRRVLEGRPEARVLTQKNSGPARAFDRAVGEARYPFIKFVDGDDILTPGATLHLLAEMRNEKVALAIGMGTVFEHHRKLFGDVRRVVVEEPLEFVARHALSASSEAMVRKSAYLEVGGCDDTVFNQGESYIHRLAIRHAIAVTDTTVRINVREGELGLNDNSVQMEHDRNAAFFALVRDFPKIPLRIKRIIFRKAATRAWLWARRKNHKALGCDPTFWLRFLSYMPWLPDYTKVMEMTCRPYRTSETLRWTEMPSRRLRRE